MNFQPFLLTVNIPEFPQSVANVEALGPLNEEFQKLGLPPLAIRIGIHTGAPRSLEDGGWFCSLLKLEREKKCEEHHRMMSVYIRIYYVYILLVYVLDFAIHIYIYTWDCTLGYPRNHNAIG